MIQKCVYFDHSTCMHVLCIYITWTVEVVYSGIFQTH